MERDQQDDGGEQSGEDENQARKPHPIEWIVGGISAVVVLAMIGFILFEAFSATGRTPRLAVTAGRTETMANGFRIGFRAFNGGDAAAAEVTVEGSLMDGEETVETSEVTLDYVPGHSERRGALLFSKYPGQYRLELNAKSYREP
ncbi:TIGR02588 family protein [Aurantimonas sp. C2-6-R+9]|uniref:TIGR02588 family protein n=1 Tax=unclassified Aurantimonas TaxID=2638230 RepID=UPI002E19427D|nr:MULTISPECIES: TIGR02588 family protein [unclassified Aurantimonas]MEC5292714.1 TIGR02588 family protein [Aurantimonas sp. C2-3-R2]MEC5382933.1 TIGR02588 family protein [Aurantimonas sp. C2-6-R+9]MEC5413748.1 TIGR02588 family protein [Aurantimonas sp. C2-4-R8]